MDIFIQFTLNSIIAGGIYALVALGFNLIYGTTKFFNLAHGALAAVGGYAVFYLFKNFTWTADSSFAIIFAVTIASIFAGFIGFLLNRFIYTPLRAKKASNMVLLMASLGAFTAIQALIAILFTSQFQTLSQESSRTFEIFGGIITSIQLTVIVLVFAISLILACILYGTRFGKAIRAISDDEEVAKIVGINTDKIIGKVFFLGSALAGLAGILVGFDTGIEPTMGMGLLLKGVIASIIGGIGNVWGGVLGGFLLGFVENFGIWKISGEWKDAIAFVLLIAFLLVRPSGILKR